MANKYESETETNSSDAGHDMKIKCRCSDRRNSCADGSSVKANVSAHMQDVVMLKRRKMPRGCDASKQIHIVKNSTIFHYIEAQRIKRCKLTQTQKGV